MKITLDVEFEIGQTVYLKTDRSQLPRLVVGYDVRPGQVIYTIQHSDEQATGHNDFEISEKPDILTTSTN